MNTTLIEDVAKHTPKSIDRASHEKSNKMLQMMFCNTLPFSSGGLGSPPATSLEGLLLKGHPSGVFDKYFGAVAIFLLWKSCILAE